ncbi:MAG: zinc ribbon domain-containing protein [Ruminococcus sp.]|jgi:DNA-directed RNA polymerase subunit RPC12/RpoP|nr:zinc ribbon domain-containing protein [Ruminococcus sp.]
MKMYKCAWCGEHTFTRLQKAFAGSLKAKGKKCPHCGKRCTNGIGSAYFGMFLAFAVLLGVLILFFTSFDKGNWIGFYAVIGLIIMQYVLQWAYDAIFGELDKSRRTYFEKNIKKKKKK